MAVWRATGLRPLLLLPRAEVDQGAVDAVRALAPRVRTADLPTHTLFGIMP